MERSYSYYKEAFAGLVMPFGFVDLDLFDENVRAIAGRASQGKTIRVASKSVRSVPLLERIFKAAKAHGKQKQVEGPLLKHGARVVIVDDVATTGKAFLQSLDVLEPMGVNVVKAICIVDRGEGAREALAERDCELVSILDISEIHKIN